jgi:serine protease AprX
VRRPFKLAIILAISAIGAAVYFGQSSPARSNGIYKIEQRVRHDLALNGRASVVIYLRSQADVSTAYGMQNENARGRFVYRTLKEHAARTQAPLIKLLQSRGVPYRAFWVANVIFTRGGTSLVHNLADRSDVSAIEANDASKWIEDEKVAKAGMTEGGGSPDAIEPGVVKVNAPQLWAMGFTGQGIVIGNQDTGMRWTHNALKPHYRGWNGSTADHNYNWHDSIHSDIDGDGTNPCGFNSQQPCDDSAHGTHTTGTTSGDDGAGNQIGVAPGAKWIGCHNMDSGTGRPETYTECFQWFIAPTDLNDQNPNPDLRPAVMNNSWGCPASELCAPTTLQTIVENTQAAGILVEASAGNAGPACNTVMDPPAVYDAAFSTGATTLNATNTLAGFSSRGDVTADGSHRLKPNISAPGVSVRSSTNSSDTSYAAFSGTSMAGPHVVGVVALLWSAYPSLKRDIATTKALLQSTANPNVDVVPDQVCGGTNSATDIPNNSFGYGLVDALAAYNGYTQPPPPLPPPPPPPPPPSQPPPKCVVPNVLHMKLAKAKARIRKRHCRVGKITKKHSSLRNRGRVVKQSPKASGKKRANGFRVKLTVGK